MCRHKTMHIFSKRNKTLKKIKVEKKKQAQTQLKKLKFNRQKPKAWTLWRIGPPKTGTHTETGQACMRRNTALAEDHHQHLLHHYSYTIHSHIHRAEREREWKEKRTFVVKMKKKIQQSNIKSKQAGFTFTDTQWDLQCDASVLCLKECELSNQLNKAKDASS